MQNIMKVCVWFFDGTQIHKGKLDDHTSEMFGFPNTQKIVFSDNSYTFSLTKRLQMSRNVAHLFGGDKSGIPIPETAHEVFPIFSKIITFDHKTKLISVPY